MSDQPTPEAVRAWMREHGTGYRKAAKHFGLTADDLRELVKGPAPHARTRARTREAEPDDEDRIPEPPNRPLTDDPYVLARWRARLSELDHALDKSVQVEEMLEQVKQAPKFNSAGAAALVTRAREAKQDVHRILANQGPLDGASPAEVAAYLTRILHDAEDEHLEIAFAVYAERHKGRVMFVGDGGHSSEYDAEQGWVTPSAAGGA